MTHLTGQVSLLIILLYDAFVFSISGYHLLLTVCLGCEYVVFRRTNGSDRRREVGTSQASGATSPDAGRLSTRLVSSGVGFRARFRHIGSDGGA